MLTPCGSWIKKVCVHNPSSGRVFSSDHCWWVRSGMLGMATWGGHCPEGDVHQGLVWRRNSTGDAELPAEGLSSEPGNLCGRVLLCQYFMSPEKYEFIGFSLLCETCWERAAVRYSLERAPDGLRVPFPLSLWPLSSCGLVVRCYLLKQSHFLARSLEDECDYVHFTCSP